MGKHSLPPVAKAFALLVLSEALLLIGVAVACIAGPKGDVDRSPIVYYSILAIVGTIGFLYFAFDCVMHENVFQLWAFIFSSALITLYVVYHYITDTLGPVYHKVALPLLVISLVYQLLYVILAFRVHSSFGWLMYKTVGADVEMGELYKSYQVLLSLLKVDVQFNVLLVILAGLFLDFRLSEILIMVVATLVGVGWAAIGYVGVRAEADQYMRVYFLLAVVEPVFVLVTVVRMYLTPEDYTNVDRPQFVITGTLALGCRVLVLIWSWNVWQNFGKGLLKVFQQHQQDKRRGLSTADGGINGSRVGKAAFSVGPVLTEFSDVNDDTPFTALQDP